MYQLLNELKLIIWDSVTQVKDHMCKVTLHSESFFSDNIIQFKSLSFEIWSSKYALPFSVLYYISF